MSEPFLAEIRIVAFTFAPSNWAFCDGQLLPIGQNSSLFSVLGNTYGGDGRVTFGLPDLRGRVPIHVGAADGVSHPQGGKGGEEGHSLGADEMPPHRHTVRASPVKGDTTIPTPHMLARSVNPIYADPVNLADMGTVAVGSEGAGQDHENMQPYLALNFCIALQGLYPQ